MLVRFATEEEFKARSPWAHRIGHYLATDGSTVTEDRYLDTYAGQTFEVRPVFKHYDRLHVWKTGEVVPCKFIEVFVDRTIKVMLRTWESLLADSEFIGTDANRFYLSQDSNKRHEYARMSQGGAYREVLDLYRDMEIVKMMVPEETFCHQLKPIPSDMPVYHEFLTVDMAYIKAFVSETGRVAHVLEDRFNEVRNLHPPKMRSLSNLKEYAKQICKVKRETLTLMKKYDIINLKNEEE